MSALTLILVIIIIAIVIAQANSLVTACRNMIIRFIKGVGAGLCSPFKKDKKPKIKKVKISFKERRRKAKMKKLRLRKYQEYIENRAIYNTEYVNSDIEVAALARTQASARENEQLKKRLKAK